MSKKKYKRVNPLTAEAMEQVVVAYHKRHLDRFVTQYLGVKLNWWQSFILRNMRLK